MRTSETPSLSSTGLFIFLFSSYRMPSEKGSEKHECDIVALVARAFGLKYATAKTPNLMLYDIVKKLLANGETYFAYFVLASVTETKILPFESLVPFLKHDQMKLVINVRDLQNKDRENSGGNQLFFVREFIVELTYTYLKSDNSKGVSKSCFRYFYDTLEYEWIAFPTVCEEGTVSVTSVSSQKAGGGKTHANRSKFLDINDEDMFGNDNDSDDDTL